MLGACTPHLQSLKPSHGTVTSRPFAVRAHSKVPTPRFRSRTLAHALRPSSAPDSTLISGNLLGSTIQTREYATGRKKSRLKAKRINEEGELEDDGPMAHLSLDSFFAPNQKVGETRIYERPKPKKSESSSQAQKPEPLDEVEEQRLLEQEYREQFDASDSELDMAFGLSSARPLGRRAAFKPTKTVAIEKLQEKGEFSLSDLSDMDYDSLKAFAVQHEIRMEDFFTRAKSEAGELSELSVPLRGLGGEEDFDQGEDGLIEHSRAYLRSHRASPKNFRDRIRVRCMAGSGGKGGVSFYRDTRVHKGPPDGGDGGDGGSVIFLAAENRKPSLASLQPSYRAASGMPGSRTRRKGKTGADVVIEVPLGTTITEFRSRPKDEFGHELMSQSEMEEEMANQPPTQAQLFMAGPNTDEMADAARRNATDNDDEKIISAETRLWREEAKHRSLYADPREGRPFAPPELPQDHPRYEGASEFHKMIANYEKASSAQHQQLDPTAPPKGFGSLSDNSGPQPLILSNSSGVRPPHTKGKSKGTSSTIVIKQEGYEEYYDEELSMMDMEDDGDVDFVSGSDLVEKYRMKGPSEAPIKTSNAPRRVELDEPGAYFVAARGGAGGLGNWRLAAVRNRPQAVATPGKPGESMMYQLELKLIADVGLVGFPNAGKSTFLSNVSRATPKIASYPFTTLCPEIGTVHADDGSQFTIADLPGLIEGAHANRGLGHQFLKHIERTSALAYVIDMSGADNRDPWKSFLTLWDELERYQKGLVKKPSLIIANKMDAGPVSQQNLTTFSKHLKADKEFKGLKLYPASASSKMNLVSIIHGLRNLIGLENPSTAASKARKFAARATEVRKSGIVTVNIASHLSEAMRNIK